MSTVLLVRLSNNSFSFSLLAYSYIYSVADQAVKTHFHVFVHLAVSTVLLRASLSNHIYTSLLCSVSCVYSSADRQSNHIFTSFFVQLAVSKVLLIGYQTTFSRLSLFS